MSGISREVLDRLDELQLQYISSVDEKDMVGWLATFSEKPQASYICTTAESVKANRPVALILDDCRGRLEDRVTFITKIWAGTFQDYQTRHIVQRTSCILNERNQFEVRSNFILSFLPSSSGESNLVMAGVYVDCIEVNEGHAKFVSKKAIADFSALPHYLVYPL